MSLHAAAPPSLIPIAQSGVAVSVTGTANETTLASFTIPGGGMGANGQIFVEALWSYTNSANNKTLKVKFGATSYLNSVQTTTSLAQTYTRVANRGAASQVGAPASTTTAFGTSTQTVTTSTVDTSADVVVTLTGQLANTGETITLESYTAYILKA